MKEKFCRKGEDSSKCKLSEANYQSAVEKLKYFVLHYIKISGKAQNWVTWDLGSYADIMFFILSVMRDNWKI